jgi:hypothetical protein
MQIVTKCTSKAEALSNKGTEEVSAMASGVSPMNMRVIVTCVNRTSHAEGTIPDYVTCSLSQMLLQKLAHSVTKIPERFQ